MSASVLHASNDQVEFQLWISNGAPDSSRPEHAGFAVGHLMGPVGKPAEPFVQDLWSRLSRRSFAENMSLTARLCPARPARCAASRFPAGSTDRPCDLSGKPRPAEPPRDRSAPVPR